MRFNSETRAGRFLCRIGAHSIEWEERGRTTVYVVNDPANWIEVQEGEPAPAGGRYCGDWPWATGHCRRCDRAIRFVDMGDR